MRLNEWIEKEGMSKKEFADAIGIRTPSLSSITVQGTRPSLLTAIKIVKFTNNEVNYEDLIDEVVEIKPRKE